MKYASSACKRIFFFAFILVALTFRIAHGAVAHYKVEEVGGFEQAESSIVRGFNNTGDVVGRSIGFGFGSQALLLTASQLENLQGLPRADWSGAHGINDSGAVGGSSNTS